MARFQARLRGLRLGRPVTVLQCRNKDGIHLTECLVLYRAEQAKKSRQSQTESTSA